MIDRSKETAMPTTYSWDVEDLMVATEGGLTNVVKKVVAIYIANDGNGHTAQQLLNVTLGPADPENFTPFASLTELQVAGWIEAIVSVANLQTLLDGYLVDQLLVKEDCPWN